ncbi:hypothetical protein H2515_12980 [Acidithiobacillus ferrivorans]|uniref:Uncharacterized protein n=2 Tax=Acidithiobacillus ferrivorans TaxID=160808 RepID=A0A7T4WD25_9PROT|nr:hypothetical protein H2515_12980 [Acidithiobacillus ferrivorans]
MSKQRLKDTIELENAAMRRRLMWPVLAIFTVIYAVSLGFGIYGAFLHWPWEISVALISSAPTVALVSILTRR